MKAVGSSRSFFLSFLLFFFPRDPKTCKLSVTAKFLPLHHVRPTASSSQPTGPQTRESLKKFINKFCAHLSPPGQSSRQGSKSCRHYLPFEAKHENFAVRTSTTYEVVYLTIELGVLSEDKFALHTCQQTVVKNRNKNSNPQNSDQYMYYTCTELSPH